MKEFILKQVLSTIDRAKDETPEDYYQRLLQVYSSLTQPNSAQSPFNEGLTADDVRL